MDRGRAPAARGSRARHGPDAAREVYVARMGSWWQGCSGGAVPSSDLPALLPDMILVASSKRRRQIQAQQEDKQELGEPSRRAGSLLGRAPGSCSCSCCAWIWRLRFGLASRIMSVNSAGRSMDGAAPLYRLAIRRPSRPRHHHAEPRELGRRTTRAVPLTGIHRIHQNDWEFDW